MSATLTAPALDLDAAELLLVAEVEQYLRSLPAPSTPAGLDLGQLLAATPVCRYGQVVQPWWAGYPDPPTPGMLDRLRSRRPIVDVTPQDHLRLTSRYLAARGWCQGQLWDSTGRVSILGAQLAVLATGYGTEATVRRARQRLGNELGRLGQPVPIDTWNDQPGRHQTGVLRLLECAATLKSNAKKIPTFARVAALNVGILVRFASSTPFHRIGHALFR